jgi:cytoskeletal protein RodZ
MKVCIGVFAAIVLTMALASMSFAQTAPAQPQDPTAQAPASQAPATPATSPNAKRPPDESTKPSVGESSASAPSTKTRPFMGTVVHENGGYFLRAGDLEYKLDDQTEARRYEGRSVKVTGNLEKQSNTIHVQKIEASPSS